MQIYFEVIFPVFNLLIPLLQTQFSNKSTDRKV